MVGKTAIKDNTLKNNKYKSDNENYNLKKSLLLNKKINKDFLSQLNLLKLEEIITLKLILSAESLNGKIFNFPIFKYTNDICKEAIFRFALSIAENRKEASLILGVKKIEIINYIKKFNLAEEFKNDSRTKKSQ
jgi:hypothetical protein